MSDDTILCAQSVHTDIARRATERERERIKRIIEDERRELTVTTRRSLLAAIRGGDHA